MHALKGGWIGQTFALAKDSNSGRPKSRIRRSKEERKEMAESFIKKYQKSNDGNFPSLNLTHKEVGGSFYTVREIVREIIQENRVLGPAKLTTEEQDMVLLSEQYPLGSISIEPQAHLSSAVETGNHHQIRSEDLVLESSVEHTGPQFHLPSSVETNSIPNHHQIRGEELVLESSVEHTGPQFHLPSSVETNSIPNHHQIRGEELVLESGGEYTGHEDHIFDNGGIISESYTEEKSEESDISVYADPDLAETSGANNTVLEVVEVTANKVTDITGNVVVETFPLRSVTKPSYSFDRELGEASIMIGNLEEKEADEVGKETGKFSVLPGKNSVEDPVGLMDEKAVTSPTDSLLEMNSSFVDEEAVKSVADLLLESSDIASVSKDIVLDDQDGVSLKVEIFHGGSSASGTFEQRQEIAENKTIDSVNGIYCDNMTGSSTGNTCGQSHPEQAVLTDKKDNIQDGSRPQRASNPSLDRINLESWEGASKKSVEPETNPFLAFIKALVTGFVKFWSE